MGERQGVRVAICDDSNMDGKLVAEMIKTFADENRIKIQVSQFSSGEAMLEAAREEGFALYILDIIMPDMDGITAAWEIRAVDEGASIAFLSSSNEYAHQSYRVQACDYLLKPVDRQQLYALLRRLYSEDEGAQKCICIQRGRGFIRLPAAQLAYLEVNQKKLYFYLTDGRVWQLPGTLAEYEAMLLIHPEFIKIHRSYIVNLQQVSQLSPNGCIMFSGKNLPISRLMYNEVRKSYMAYLFGDTEV